MSTWQSAQALAVPTSPSNFQNVLTYRWPCPIGRRQQSHRCGFLAVLSVWFQTSQGSRSSSHISVLEVRRAPDRDLGVVGPGGGRLRRLGPVLLVQPGLESLGGAEDPLGVRGLRAARGGDEGGLGVGHCCASSQTRFRSAGRPLASSLYRCEATVELGTQAVEEIGPGVVALDHSRSLRITIPASIAGICVSAPPACLISRDPDDARGSGRTCATP